MTENGVMYLVVVPGMQECLCDHEARFGGISAKHVAAAAAAAAVTAATAGQRHQERETAEIDVQRALGLRQV